MEIWFFGFIIVIVGFSLLYYGYIEKKKYEYKGKELELEQKKLDLRMKELEHSSINKESVEK
ncbi:hypothetical protein ACSVDE_01485 [Pseudalkalibacillus sp. Hm43]|uniref:hypothetical protein n=1 Tax=Pseudalkalibacillus sp. Hm43 TaxID=3450742 RepID=UPI003F4362C6